MRIDQIIAILLCIIAIAAIINYEWKSVKKRWKGQKVLLRFQFDEYKLFYCLGIASLTFVYVWPNTPMSIGMTVFGILMLGCGKYGRRIDESFNEPF